MCWFERNGKKVAGGSRIVTNFPVEIDIFIVGLTVFLNIYLYTG
jgi:hypothetical protein